MYRPDANTYQKASTDDLKPVRMSDDSLSFMFETSYMLQITQQFMQDNMIDTEYYKCWEPLKRNFNPNKFQ